MMAFHYNYDEYYYYYKATHTPIVLPQSLCTIEFLDNSHISELALELHSRAAPSVGGIIAQLFQPQGKIPEEGRKKSSIS